MKKSRELGYKMVEMCIKERKKQTKTNFPKSFSNTTKYQNKLIPALPKPSLDSSGKHILMEEDSNSSSEPCTVQQVIKTHNLGTRRRVEYLKARRAEKCGLNYNLTEGFSSFAKSRARSQGVHDS